MRLVIALALMMAAPNVARADDVAKADRLFREGLALKDTNVTQACVKFEESLQYNTQAIGTLLNVALCDERLGRIASAVGKYREARDRAREQNLPEHLAAAEERIAKLEPDLPHITITFTEPPTDDTRILIDDKVIPLERAIRQPEDPGKRVIVVTAPGRVTFKTTVELRLRQVEEVVVPRLAPSAPNTRRTFGKIITASGGLTLATGITLGLVARSRYNSVDCGPEKMCDSNDDHLVTESARTLGTVGTVVGIVGLATIGVGAYLWIRSPKATDSPRVSIVPGLGPDGGGILAIGRF